MSLTVALSILGVLVLVALLAHGWWSARRASPRQADAPLPAPQRVEPGFARCRACLPAPRPTRTSGVLRPRGARRGWTRWSMPSCRCRWKRRSAARVLAHWPATRRAGTKPFHIEGLNIDSGDWEQPAAGQRYSELQAGVQLANRSGALNEIEYSEFVHKLQAFAEGVGAMPDFPDMLDVVARARELDGFAGPLDAQLAVRLVARSVAWSVGYVQQCAGRQGLVPGAVAGRLVLPAADEGAPPVLVLEFDAQAALADDPQAAALREVILSLDVPQTPAAVEPFPAWHKVAHALAEDMDAELLDDAGRPITLHAFDAIGRDLDQLYAALDTHDLAAGSPAARRLFAG